MKMIVLAAAMLAIGATAAYAGEGDGETAVTAQWHAANGIQRYAASEGESFHRLEAQKQLDRYTGATGHFGRGG